MAVKKEELKSFLRKVKEESEKTGLKLSIQKSKIMAFGPIERAVELKVFLLQILVLGKKVLPGSRFPGELAITSDMQMTPPLWQKVKKN